MFSTSTKAAANMTKNLAEDDIKNSAKNMGREAQNAANDAQDAVHGVVEDLSTYANQAGQKVRQMIDTAGEEFSSASSRVTNKIRTNPVRSSLIALGAGFVIGALFRR